MVFPLAACSAVQAADRTDVETAQEKVITSSATEHQTITVVGEGKISLEPDMATINVGAESRADTATEAKSEVETIMAAVSEALQQMSIAEKDIQTSHFIIHYEREPLSFMPDGGPQEFREYYYVSNMVRVAVRDVELAGDVLDAVVQSGANQIHGVSYTVSDRSSWLNQAQALAVEDARSQAEELAELNGLTLGEVLSVSEIIGGVPMPLMRIEGGMGGGGGISPGELELTTQIQMTFGVH
jgi:hypothetical protein